MGSPPPRHDRGAPVCPLWPLGRWPCLPPGAGPVGPCPCAPILPSPWPPWLLGSLSALVLLRSLSLAPCPVFLWSFPPAPAAARPLGLLVLARKLPGSPAPFPLGSLALVRPLSPPFLAPLAPCPLRLPERSPLPRARGGLGRPPPPYLPSLRPPCSSLPLVRPQRGPPASRRGVVTPASSSAGFSSRRLFLHWNGGPG